MDEITRKVKQLYTQFPLPNFEMPEFPSEAQLAEMGPMHRLDYNFYICFPYYKRFEGKKMLDAGCGTGSSTYRYAVRNPDTEILGVDLSDKSVFLAEQRLAKRGVKNVRFRQVNLMDPRVLDGEGPFDFIASEGVIHHLSDPVTGLRHLVERLTEDGLIFLALYTEQSRRRVAQMRELIDMLLEGEERDDFARGLGVAKRLFADLHRGGRLEPALAAYINTDQEIADTFLHSREKRYTFDDLFALLDEAGLELVRFLPECMWAPETYLSDPDLLRRAAGLGRLERLRLAEIVMTEQPLYQFFARRKSFNPERKERSDEELLAAVPRFVPFVRLETSQGLDDSGGFGEPGHGKLVFRDSLRELADIPLDAGEMALVKVVDGKRSLSEAIRLAASTGAEVDADDLAGTASLFRRLEAGKAVCM